MKSTTTQRNLGEPIENLVMVGAKVKPELHFEIKKIAQERNVSISYLVEEALTFYLQKYHKEEV